MASESAMQLDWRRPLSSTKILVSIRKLLALIDEKGKVPMWLYSSMLNSSKGAKLVFLDDEDCETDGDSGLRMWAHTFKKSTMKRDPTYLAKLLSVSRTSIEDVTKGVLVPMRLYGYRWVGTNISKDTSRKILMDLALKLNIHPYCLGIVPETKGRIYIPDGWKIKQTVVKDMSAFKDDSIEAEGVYDDLIWGSYKEIHPLVSKLELLPRKSATPIRAVLVVEHRNIQYILNAVKRRQDPRFAGIMHILTGGFSDYPTREYLHMLEADPNLAETPFLFLSDLDAHSMQIFADLKYASMRSAYASRIMVCSKLQWAGLSTATYKKLAKRWPERMLKYYDLKNPHASATDRNDVKQKAKQQTDNMLTRLKRPAARLTEANKQRIQHIHRHKLIDSEVDELAYLQLLEMGMNEYGHAQAVCDMPKGGLVGLASLAQYNAYGIEEGYLAVLVEAGVQLEAGNIDLLPESQYEQASRIEQQSNGRWTAVIHGDPGDEITEEEDNDRQQESESEDLQDAQNVEDNQGNRDSIPSEQWSQYLAF